MGREDYSGKMGLKPQIDSKSGFCYGVVRAIEEAERYLEKEEKLNSLGSIVHNTREVERLAKLGIEVIDYQALENLKESTLLIRAHGEPPATYKLAKENRVALIDCTCPVVLKLQERIKEGHRIVKKSGGSVALFGKRNHAEVLGLLGQVDGDAVVLESIGDIEQLNLTKPIALYAQTTMDPIKYQQLIEAIEAAIEAKGGSGELLTVHDTICRQVSSRHDNLREFAKENHILLFVSGKASSNGKVLFEICKGANSRSYKIEGIEEIDLEWFNKGERVGICGATSTPTWQLEEVANFIKSI